jgi:DnaJ-class molecular chaperone
MKRVNEYRKLFSADEKTDLKQLKNTYRTLVKEWHPDKFQDGDEKKAEAEFMGQKVIDAYHFLVSIAPETRETNLDEYNRTLNEEGIQDYKHKGLLLQVTFTDGSTYEYFGVTANGFAKFHNSDKQMRFGKRSIFNSFLYRKSKKAVAQEA